jgi:hypothetical protein
LGIYSYFCADPEGGRKPINAKRETVRTLPDLPVMPICIHRPDTANMPLDAKRMIYGAPLLR